MRRLNLRFTKELILKGFPKTFSLPKECSERTHMPRLPASYAIRMVTPEASSLPIGELNLCEARNAAEASVKSKGGQRGGRGFHALTSASSRKKTQPSLKKIVSFLLHLLKILIFAIVLKS